MLRRIYADTPFLETLKKEPSCLQFVRDFLSKKREPEGGSVMSIGRACSSFLQSPVKLQDPGDFAIPCCIGDTQIEGALCDLGASVSLMPPLPLPEAEIARPHPHHHIDLASRLLHQATCRHPGICQLGWPSLSSHATSLLWTWRRAPTCLLF